MHVLFLSDNFPPEVNAPASRTFEHCREWVGAGHSVTVITSAPNFPRGRVFPGYRNRLWQVETVEGIRVLRVWTYIAPNEGFARRIVDFLSYALFASMAAMFVPRPDVVVATSPQFFAAAAGWVVSVARRAPFVFELRDLWPESIRVVGALERSWVLDLLERLELFLYRRATRIVSVTKSFRSNLSSRGIDPSKVDVITNGVDTTRFAPRPRDPLLTSSLQLNGRFVAGYIGTHGVAHGLTTVLDAAEILQSSPDAELFQFILVGDGAERASLQADAERRGLRNLTMVDAVPKDEIVRFWSVLDVSIIHLKKADLFRTVIPSKLFESMGMGVPIVLGVEGESAEIVREEGVGVTFEPEDAVALVAVLRQLRAEPNRLAKFRHACAGGAKKYDRRALAKIMLTSLTEAYEAR